MLDAGLQVSYIAADGISRGLVPELYARAEDVSQCVEFEPDAVGACLEPCTQVVEVAMLAADAPIGDDGVAVLAAPQEVRDQIRDLVLECRGRHHTDGGVGDGRAGVVSQFDGLYEWILVMCVLKNEVQCMWYEKKFELRKEIGRLLNMQERQ